MNSRRRRVVRWKALVPLGLVLALLAVAYLLMADRIARQSLEEAGSQLLGVEVSVEGLRILEREAAVELTGLQIADPFDSLRNLVQAESIRLQLAPAPLLEKKIIVRDLELMGLGFRTRRSRPARKIEGEGLAQTTIGALRDWGTQLQQAPLAFLRADTLRQLVLNPENLESVAAARALRGMTDSLRLRGERALEQIRVDSAVARARALAARMERTDVSSLGVTGVRQLASDVRGSLSQLDSVAASLALLETEASRAVATLDSAIDGLDRARQRDYATAREALGLPSLDGPSFGTALFGKVSLGYVQRATYWTQMAMKYLPPGLQPRLRPGSARLRRPGTDVSFPREGDLPGFMIERGALGAEIGGASYQGQLNWLSTAPALVGRPATIRLERSGTTAAALVAVLDHTGAIPRDSVGISLQGVELPAFGLGDLPIEVDPGVGAMTLSGVFSPDDLRVRWDLVAPAVTWVTDTTRPRGMAEQLVWRVLNGLSDLRVSATIQGSLSSPSISVSSNLDEALRDRIRTEAEGALAAAREAARREVDRLAGQALTAATREAQGLRDLLPADIGQQQESVAAQKADLERRLRGLTGGLGGILGGR